MPAPAVIVEPTDQHCWYRATVGCSSCGWLARSPVFVSASVGEGSVGYVWAERELRLMWATHSMRTGCPGWHDDPVLVATS